MLKLDKPAEPQKIILRAAAGEEPEAFIVMAPITRAMRRRAHRAVNALLGVVDDPDKLDLDLIGDAAEKGSRELIRLGVIDWGGIGDEDDNPLPVTPDRDTRFATANAPDRPTGTVDLLLADDAIFEKIEAEYVRPDGIRRAEKNALSASPPGTGGAGTPAKGTANSPANRKARRAGAKRARTASTRSKAKPPKASGRR